MVSTGLLVLLALSSVGCLSMQQRAASKADPSRSTDDRSSRASTPVPNGGEDTRSAARDGAASPALEHLEAFAVLLMLEDRQSYEPESLALLSGDDAPAVRERTAEAIGRIGDVRGAGLLASLATDPSLPVRRAAVFALGELGERGAVGAVDALLSATVDVDRTVGRLAVEALGKSGVGIESVIARLVDAPPDELLPRLLPSLYRFEGILGWVEQGLESSDPALRRDVAHALARGPQPAMAPTLRALLADDDPQIRAWAAKGLGTVGERGDLDRLAPLLSDPAPGPRIQALRAGRKLVDAGTAPPDDAWRAPLLGLITGTAPGATPHVRATAIEASSAWLLDESLGDALAELAGGASRAAGTWYRELALLSLAEGADPRAGELATAALAAQEPSVRAVAVRAAGLADTWQSVADGLEDVAPGVRRAAYETLFASEIADGPVLANLALGDDDFAVRSTALDWLAESPELPLETLASALLRAREDAEPDAALSALGAMEARAAGSSSERGTLIALLEEAAEDRRWLVRRRAIRALETLDSSRTQEALDGSRSRAVPALGDATDRPIAFYRETVRRTISPKLLRLETTRGAVDIELACPRAPRTCLSFLQLAGAGFFDDLPFHRIVPDFVVQGGDPSGHGSGGPGYSLRDEIGRLRFDAGVLGMAHAGAHTAGSQFFLTLSPQPHLDGSYTAFGIVVGGFDVLEQLERGDRVERTVFDREAEGRPSARLRAETDRGDTLR